MDKYFIPKEVYEVILDKIPVCTVDVIFLNSKKDKTLLFCRNNEPLKGVYFSTGGGLRKDETLLECAVRQAKGELGLDIDPNKTFFGGVQQENHPNSAFNGISYQTVNLFYGYILDNENVSITFDKQHSDYKWFDVNDPSINLFMQGKIKKTLQSLHI